MASANRLSYENATKVLQYLRNFLAGKKLQIASRHALSQSSRSIPEPNLPSGQAHKLGNNYYYTRDSRRVVGPPVKIQSSELIGPGGKSEVVGNVTPGDVYHPRP
ncbi:NADH dehydrogenase [ubiquinone] 1 alpha subcomplex subunit 7-like [Rhopilema esculentum]|uniref:NADH dehydrogenase [ubiquinone] 1 alpha subcomplex subunit 7-like n=1 Tax=Rhopilema esculentum TaxID=499914 RepID=UPI0031E0DC9B|eukprot:gene4583-20850_t